MRSWRPSVMVAIAVATVRRSSSRSWPPSITNRWLAASGSITVSSGSQLTNIAVERPACRAAFMNEGASVRSGAGVLSVNPWAAGSTPRKIEAWTGSVHGGVTVRALKHDAPSSARVVSAGMVARVMWRGANPSIDTTSTGERRAVVPEGYDRRLGFV